MLKKPRKLGKNCEGANTTFHRKDTLKPLDVSGNSEVSGEGWSGRLSGPQAKPSRKKKDGESRCSSLMYETK